MDTTALSPSTRDEIKVLLWELKGAGLVHPERSPARTRFTTALEVPQFLAKEDEELTLGLVSGLENIVQARAKHQIPLFKICVLLKEIFQCSDNELAKRIGKASRSTGTFSRAWISRNIKAGRFLSEFPELADIHDVERLCTIARMPRGELVKHITPAGREPTHGLDLRKTPRPELARYIQDLKQDSLSRDETLQAEISELAASMKRLETRLPGEDPVYSQLKERLRSFCEDLGFGKQRTVFSIRQDTRQAEHTENPQQSAPQKFAKEQKAA